MLHAVQKEILLRKGEAEAQTVETIYFGGGTPSLLSNEEIEMLLDTVYNNYSVSENPEITLEANPDDLSAKRIKKLSETRINRLSIGIQSFFEDDLKMMNRAHNAAEAENCLHEATKYFNNISIDLIYGIPGMDNEKWNENIKKALSFRIPHISSYALTVEPKTALHSFIKKGILPSPDDEAAQNHFTILVEKLEAEGFIHYELSNFGKEGYFSKNNSAYWLGKKYIGVGPSAHSYNGITRSWNVANNTIYIKSLEQNKMPSEREKLTVTERYNEYIMTGLRTIWGISLQRIQNDFGEVYFNYLKAQSQKHLQQGLIIIDNEIITTTQKGKFLSDGIASDLFFIED